MSEEAASSSQSFSPAEREPRRFVDWIEYDDTVVDRVIGTLMEYGVEKGLVPEGNLSYRNRSDASVHNATKSLRRGSLLRLAPEDDFELELAPGEDFSYSISKEDGKLETSPESNWDDMGEYDGVIAARGIKPSTVSDEQIEGIFQEEDDDRFETIISGVDVRHGTHSAVRHSRRRGDYSHGDRLKHYDVLAAVIPSYSELLSLVAEWPDEGVNVIGSGRVSVDGETYEL